MNSLEDLRYSIDSNSFVIFSIFWKKDEIMLSVNAFFWLQIFSKIRLSQTDIGIGKKSTKSRGTSLCKIFSRLVDFISNLRSYKFSKSIKIATFQMLFKSREFARSVLNSNLILSSICLKWFVCNFEIKKIYFFGRKLQLSWWEWWISDDGYFQDRL